MQAMESAFDVCTEDLFNQTVKLEEMEKKAGNAEGEVSALRSRLILLQENNEKQEDRLAKLLLNLPVLASGPMERCEREPSWRTASRPTRSQLTAWTSSWPSPSSPWPPPRASSTTSRGSSQPWRRTPPGATRGLR